MNKQPLKRPGPIKLSSLDKSAPPGVDVIIRLAYPPTRIGRTFSPGRVICDYRTDQIELAQERSDKLKQDSIEHTWMTWWRKDGRHVRKWQTLMHGKDRHFHVRIPFTSGLTDGQMKQAIQEGAWEKLADIKREFSIADVHVAINDVANRGERGAAATYCVYGEGRIMWYGTEEDCIEWAKGGLPGRKYRVRPLVFGD